MSTSGIAAALTITLAIGIAAQGTFAQQAPTTASAPANRSAKDVKGWRGAEWGMTPDKVAAALGQKLGEVKTSTRDPAQTYYELEGLAVGEWIADVELGFKQSAPGTEASNRQLVYVILGFKLTDGKPDFTKVRDELKATYGDPTSEEDERHPQMGNRNQYARWTLPSTQITCHRAEVVPSDQKSHFMYVRFDQRVKAF